METMRGRKEWNGISRNEKEHIWNENFSSFNSSLDTKEDHSTWKHSNRNYPETHREEMWENINLSNISKTGAP